MGTHLLWPLVPILLDLHLTGLISSITATISSVDATISKLNQSVTEGEDVTFLCNGSITETAVQVTWEKDNVPLITQLIGNKTVYYPSDRMSVDVSHLNISDVEQSDSGIYSCRVTNDIKGEQTTAWTLTIIQRTNSSESEQSAQRLIIILSCRVIGGLVLLVGLSCCVWFYRRQKEKQAALSHREASGEESPAPPVNRRRQRSQYIERLNSVYAEY